MNWNLFTYIVNVLVPWKNPWLPLSDGLILVPGGEQTSIANCQPHPPLIPCSLVGEERGIFPVPNAVNGVLGLLFLECLLSSSGNMSELPSAVEGAHEPHLRAAG